MIRGCGTHRGYFNGCRCDPCRAALSARRTEIRRAKGIGPRVTPEHGSVSRYTNYACRCQGCTEAQRVYVSNYRKAPTP